MANDDQAALARQEQERLAKRLAARYPSHGKEPVRAEILDSDPPELRRAKKRYPSHYGK